MKMNGFISVKGFDTHLTLLPSVYHYDIHLLGASVTVDQKPSFKSDHPHPQITLRLKQGEEGVVAVAVRNRDSKHVPIHAYFFKISWKKKEGEEKLIPWIDLENPWTPPTRRGRIDPEYFHIEALIGERVYSGHSGGGHRDHANLLCRYLYGTASEEEVLRAIVYPEVLKPFHVLRVRGLEAQVATLTEQNLRFEGREVRRCFEIDQLRAEKRRMNADLLGTVQALGDANEMIGKLKTELRNAASWLESSKRGWLTGKHRLHQMLLTWPTYVRAKYLG